LGRDVCGRAHKLTRPQVLETVGLVAVDRKLQGD